MVLVIVVSCRFRNLGLWCFWREGGRRRGRGWVGRGVRGFYAGEEALGFGEGEDDFAVEGGFAGRSVGLGHEGGY